MQIWDFLSPFTQRLQPRMKGVLLKVILGLARNIEEIAEVRQLIEATALNGESTK
jgi:hypothetical protein